MSLPVRRDCPRRAGGGLGIVGQEFHESGDDVGVDPAIGIGEQEEGVFARGNGSIRCLRKPQIDFRVDNSYKGLGGSVLAGWKATIIEDNDFVVDLSGEFLDRVYQGSHKVGRVVVDDYDRDFGGRLVHLAMPKSLFRRCGTDLMPRNITMNTAS